MKRILVCWKDEHFPRSDRQKIINVPDENAGNWRDLQIFFDPGYHCDNLRFFSVGEEIGHEVGK